VGFVRDGNQWNIQNIKDSPHLYKYIKNNLKIKMFYKKKGNQHQGPQFSNYLFLNVRDTSLNKSSQM